MILLCSISCSEINGSVVDCANGIDDSDLFEFITCRHLLCKIRFEAPMRQRGRDEDIKGAEVKFTVIYIWYSGYSLLISL
jgi:hypothetical protein